MLLGMEKPVQIAPMTAIAPDVPARLVGDAERSFLAGQHAMCTREASPAD